MTDPRDEMTLASMDKRLALIEQAQTLGTKAADAQSAAQTTAINALGTRMDAAITLMTSMSAEPEGSPMGRAIVREIRAIKAVQADHEEKLGEHGAYFDQLKGSIGTLKAASLGLGAVATLLGIIAVVQTFTQGGS